MTDQTESRFSGVAKAPSEPQRAAITAGEGADSRAQEQKSGTAGPSAERTKKAPELGLSEEVLAWKKGMVQEEALPHEVFEERVNKPLLDAGVDSPEKFVTPEAQQQARDIIAGLQASDHKALALHNVTELTDLLDALPNLDAETKKRALESAQALAQGDYPHGMYFDVVFGKGENGTDLTAPLIVSHPLEEGQKPPSHDLPEDFFLHHKANPESSPEKAKTLLEEYKIREAARQAAATHDTLREIAAGTGEQRTDKTDKAPGTEPALATKPEPVRKDPPPLPPGATKDDHQPGTDIALRDKHTDVVRVPPGGDDGDPKPAPLEDDLEPTAAPLPRANEPEPDPTAEFPPAQPVPLEQEAPIIRTGLVVNREADARKRAHKLAEQQLRASYRKHHFLNIFDLPRKALLKVSEGHYLRRGSRRGIEKMREANNINADVDVMGRGVKKVRFQGAGAHLAEERAAGKAKLAQLRMEREAKIRTDIRSVTGETHTLMINEVFNRIIDPSFPTHPALRDREVQDLLRGFVSRHVNDHNKDVRRQVQAVFGKDATAFKQVAQFFATDLLELGDQVKADIANGFYKKEEVPQHVRFEFANADWAASTKIKLAAGDRFVTAIEPLINETTASVGIAIGFQVAKQGARKAIGFAMLGGGIFAALSRGKNVARDMRTTRTDREYGSQQLNRPERKGLRKAVNLIDTQRKLQRYQYETASVAGMLTEDRPPEETFGDGRSLAKLMQLDITPSNPDAAANRAALVRRVAEIRERMRYSAAHQVGLIEFGGEFQVEQNRLTLVQAIVAGRRKLINAGFTEAEVDQELQRCQADLWQQRFMRDINDQNVEFNIYRAKSMITFGIFGVAASALTAIGTQQGIAEGARGAEFVAREAAPYVDAVAANHPNLFAGAAVATDWLANQQGPRPTIIENFFGNHEAKPTISPQIRDALVNAQPGQQVQIGDLEVHAQGTGQIVIDSFKGQPLNLDVPPVLTYDTVHDNFTFQGTLPPEASHMLTDAGFKIGEPQYTSQALFEHPEPVTQTIPGTNYQVDIPAGTEFQQGTGGLELVTKDVPPIVIADQIQFDQQGAMTSFHSVHDGLVALGPDRQIDGGTVDSSTFLKENGSNVHHWGWYDEQIVGKSDHQELQLNNYRAGEQGVRWDITHMTGTATNTSGALPPLDVQDAIQNNNVAMAFWSHGNPDQAILVRMDHGQLTLDQANPNQMVDVYINGQWTQMSGANVAKLVFADDLGDFHSNSDGSGFMDKFNTNASAVIIDQNADGTVNLRSLATSIGHGHMPDTITGHTTIPTIDTIQQPTTVIELPATADADGTWDAPVIPIAYTPRLPLKDARGRQAQRKQRALTYDRNKDNAYVLNRFNRREAKRPPLIPSRPPNLWMPTREMLTPHVRGQLYGVDQQGLITIAPDYTFDQKPLKNIALTGEDVTLNFKEGQPEHIPLTLQDPNFSIVHKITHVYQAPNGKWYISAVGSDQVMRTYSLEEIKDWKQGVMPPPGTAPQVIPQPGTPPTRPDQVVNPTPDQIPAEIFQNDGVRIIRYDPIPPTPTTPGGWLPIQGTPEEVRNLLGRTPNPQDEALLGAGLSVNDLNWLTRTGLSFTQTELNILAAEAKRIGAPAAMTEFYEYLRRRQPGWSSAPATEAAQRLTSENPSYEFGQYPDLIRIPPSNGQPELYNGKPIAGYDLSNQRGDGRIYMVFADGSSPQAFSRMRMGPDGKIYTLTDVILDPQGRLVATVTDIDGNVVEQNFNLKSFLSTWRAPTENEFNKAKRAAEKARQQAEKASQRAERYKPHPTSPDALVGSAPVKPRLAPVESVVSDPEVTGPSEKIFEVGHSDLILVEGLYHDGKRVAHFDVMNTNNRGIHFVLDDNSSFDVSLRRRGSDGTIYLVNDIIRNPDGTFDAQITNEANPTDHPRVTFEQMLRMSDLPVTPDATPAPELPFSWKNLAPLENPDAVRRGEYVFDPQGNLRAVSNTSGSGMTVRTTDGISNEQVPGDQLYRWGMLTDAQGDPVGLSRYLRTENPLIPAGQREKAVELLQYFMTDVKEQKPDGIKPYDAKTIAMIYLNVLLHLRNHDPAEQQTRLTENEGEEIADAIFEYEGRNPNSVSKEEREIMGELAGNLYHQFIDLSNRVFVGKTKTQNGNPFATIQPPAANQQPPDKPGGLMGRVSGVLGGARTMASGLGARLSSLRLGGRTTTPVVAAETPTPASAAPPEPLQAEAPVAAAVQPNEPPTFVATPGPATGNGAETAEVATAQRAEPLAITGPTAGNEAETDQVADTFDTPATPATTVAPGDETPEETRGE